MRAVKEVGIVGWGSYIPRYRIKIDEIARTWGKRGEWIRDELLIEEKAVNGIDEDVATMAVEAVKNALKRAKISPSELGAVFVGTESKPYAVKPTSTLVAEAIGATPYVLAADLEFACKAGTEALQCCFGLVGSGMVKYGLAVGADTAQGAPADALEYSAASGGTAFIVGSKGDEVVASLEGSTSYVTDTPDFWRRSGKVYPSHTEGFTGDPAYFRHQRESVHALLKELGLKPSDFDHVVFHQPNGKFPLRIAKQLGFTKEQLMTGYLVPWIGNTYAGSAITGFSAVLDSAKPGQRLLLVSFGSGAGSDAFSFIVKDNIVEKQHLAPLVRDYIDQKEYVDYALYARYRGKILLS